MPQYNYLCTVTLSELYMFIEQLQMTSITFSTCVIMLHFKFFCLKATENFLAVEGGGTTEAPGDSFQGSTVLLLSKTPL